VSGINVHDTVKGICEKEFKKMFEVFMCPHGLGKEKKRPTKNGENNKMPYISESISAELGSEYRYTN
jgi:hypothetical protein